MGRGPASEAVPHLARALRALRLRAGLSQEQVAEGVRAGGEGLSRTYYQQIESGRRYPSPDLRAAILAVLGASDADLPAAAAAPAPPRPAPATRAAGPVV
ncbi:MAG: helix-turn-helix transcriptional regulator, partial [Miltoncostaeaceae bacterium]